MRYCTLSFLIARFTSFTVLYRVKIPVTLRYCHVTSLSKSSPIFVRSDDLEISPIYYRSDVSLSNELKYTIKNMCSSQNGSKTILPFLQNSNSSDDLQYGTVTPFRRETSIFLMKQARNELT